MTDAMSFYKEKYADYSLQLKEIKRNQLTLVIARLVVFVLMIFVPLAFAGRGLFPALLVFMVLLAGFLLLVKKSARLESRRRYITSLLDINMNEIQALRGNFGSFDDGGEFIDPDHQYSLDLDIFGPGSVFQYINRCCTLGGKEQLSKMLLIPGNGPDIILKKQKTFRELSSRIDWCQKYMATGMMFKEQPADRLHLQNYVNSPSQFTKNSLLLIASRVLPAITLLILALVVAGVLPFFAFALLFLLQLGITGALLKRINEIHGMVTSRLETLKKYGKLLYIIQQANFESPLLKSLLRHLVTERTYPSGHIKKLAGIVSAFDNRLNMIAALLLNGLFLWDLNCVLFLERWNRKHRKQLPVWLDSVARMDAFISFAVFSFNNPGYIFPRPLKEGPVINADSLGHPLIAGEERVCNDFSIDDNGRFIIITGANMAGKSTFLRTAGVAMILAMAGAPVCAQSFRFRVMEVYSSMRTSDSLTKHESYFYAELKRLKHLIEKVAHDKPVFVILDEILKGTNSSDKQKGSMAIMERMIAMKATGIIATHDLSLTSLEKKYPEQVTNKCFEIGIEGDRIFFDYQLRDGVTRKMNALLLMRQMGLLSEQSLEKLKSGD